MHICPAFPVIFPQAILLAALLTCAFPVTMHGFFPPSSRSVGVRCLAAAAATIRPTPPPPVYDIASTLCLSNSDPTSAPPFTTLTTSASTYSPLDSRSVSNRVVWRDNSDIFSTQTFPAASASTSGLSASSTGMFHGVISVATPRGSTTTSDRTGAAR